MNNREILKDKHRIVIKIGTSTLTGEDGGEINEELLRKFAKILTNLKKQGKELVVVSSGAVGVGRSALGFTANEKSQRRKRACAAVGQAKLMRVYEDLFAGFGVTAAQLLLTREALMNTSCRQSTKETFLELLGMGTIPIVNENDTVSTDGLQYGRFGDNDTLAAHVAKLINADLLILMSDIDGLYTDDPKDNPGARLISYVETIDERLMKMGKGAGSRCGTGGMATKLRAARIATRSGADMIIANGMHISNIRRIVAGNEIGTLFKGKSV